MVENCLLKEYIIGYRGYLGRTLTMLERDWLIVMGMGGVFIILGLAAFFWGKGEKKSYYDAISTRSDVREYVEHSPRRPEPEALKIGGWIAIAIGILILAIGGLFWLLN